MPGGMVATACPLMDAGGMLATACALMVATACTMEAAGMVAPACALMVSMPAPHARRMAAAWKRRAWCPPLAPR